MVNKNELLELINSQFPLVKKDIGDMAKAKVSPMKFEIEQYEATGLGNVSFMSASGMFGLMKMDTMIINPFELDAPLHSYDFISAMGNITLLEDLFDTRLEKDEFANELKTVVSTYNNLEKAEVESKWYDSIRLPQSLFIKGKKKDSIKFDQIVKEYTKAYLLDCKMCKPCNRDEKIYASQVYTEGLLNNGGPSTDIFVKKKGLEYTQNLFREILFATKTPK